jgi:hypothetical protein
MIVGRGDVCVSQPGRGGRGIDMAASINGGRSLIESNDQECMTPVRAGSYQRHERLEKSVALSRRAVVHVVGHVRHHQGKVDDRIEIRERLNVRALHRIEPNTFKTDRRIVFPDILPWKTRAIDTARK